AVKFTSEGCITISAQLLQTLDNSVLVQIEVRDTGIGIADKALDKIFMPFTQEDDSTIRQFGGTGLGLTISRHLAELMGGSISAASTPGSGSCFKVNLPFTTVQRGYLAEAASQKTAHIWDGPRLRILLVEDNPVNITFETKILRKLGHDVVTAVNGRDCLAELEQGQFDLVLMDIQMPVMNGEDA